MYECPIRGVLPHENDSLICISTTSLNCSTTQVTLKQFYDSHSRSNITKLSFHWQDEPAMFFILPNHLPPKSIHLDHLLLRVFASILPFLLHTICLSSFSPSQHPSLNHFIITSFWPVRHHQLALVFFFFFLPPQLLLCALDPLNVLLILHPGRANFTTISKHISWWLAQTAATPDSQRHVSRLSCWAAHYHLELLAAQTTHPHGLSLTPDRN